MAQKPDFKRAPRPPGYVERNPQPEVPAKATQPDTAPAIPPLSPVELRAQFSVLAAKFSELAAEVRKLGADLAPPPTKGAGADEVFQVLDVSTQPPAETYLRGRHRLAEFLDMSPLTVGQYLSTGCGEFKRGDHVRVRRVLS